MASALPEAMREVLRRKSRRVLGSMDLSPLDRMTLAACACYITQHIAAFWLKAY
jgi:hypothetical protein